MKTVPGLALLHDLAALHHHDAVGHRGRDFQVVGDQDQRHTVFGLEVAQKVEDLRLDADVQGGGRLVRDDDRWLQGDGHRDHHALPLAAGELVRILVDPVLRIGDADAAEQIDHAALRIGTRSDAVGFEHFRDLAADGVDRVEIGQRVLEDHRDLPAVDVAPFLLASWSRGRGPRRTCGRRRCRPAGCRSAP